MGLRSTYTYTTLEIEEAAFDHILLRLHAAGAEYVERYYEVNVEKKRRMIHFNGSEVALVTALVDKDKLPCKCKGLYQPPDCPRHRKR